MRNVQPRGKTELIITVKVETRHPAEDQFDGKFTAIGTVISFIYLSILIV